VWWALLGASLGGAVLMKPPAIGGFFFLVLAAHHAAARTGLPLSARVGRPLLALSVAGLVAGPWYALIYHRLKLDGLRQLFLFNSVGRMRMDWPTDYPRLPFWTYVEWTAVSARAAMFFWPALAVGLVCAAAGWHRRGWWLPTMLAGAFYLAISCSALKYPHYAYYGMPFLFILGSAVVMVGWLPRPRLAGSEDDPVAVWCWRALAVAGVVVAAGVVRTDLRELRNRLRQHVYEYPPVVVYRAAEPHIRDGGVRFVVYKYPNYLEPLDGRLGFGVWDRHNRPKMPLAERVNTPGELYRVAAAGRPAVVFLPPKLPREQAVVLWWFSRADRMVRLRSERASYTVLLYHGAESELGLTEFLQMNQVPPAEPERF
jgi:hypothetical protein